MFLWLYRRTDLWVSLREEHLHSAFPYGTGEFKWPGVPSNQWGDLPFGEHLPGDMGGHEEGDLVLFNDDYDCDYV